MGAKNAPNFYYHILPELRRDPVFNIVESTDVSSQLHDEALFSFFLDTDGVDLTCEAYVDYGNGPIKLTQLQDTDFPLPEERDMNQEFPVHNLLYDLFPGYDPDRGIYYSLTDDDEKYFSLGFFFKRHKTMK